MVGASRERLCKHFLFLALHYYGFLSRHGVGYEVGGLLVIAIGIGWNGVHGMGIWNIPLRWLGMGWEEAFGCMVGSMRTPYLYT